MTDVQKQEALDKHIRECVEYYFNTLRGYDDSKDWIKATYEKFDSELKAFISFDEFKAKINNSIEQIDNDSILSIDAFED